MAGKRGSGGGNPTLYRKKYNTEVVDYLAKGHSLVAWAGAIGVNPRTVSLWRQAHPEFQTAVQIGQAKALVYYEQALKRLIETGEGNAQIITFALRNRGRDAGWDDRQITEHHGEILKVEINRRDPESLSVEELQRLLDSAHQAREIMALPEPEDASDGEE